MTVVNINLKNVGSGTSPIDSVTFYSPVYRDGATTSELVSTAEENVPLVDGVAAVDLIPGPVRVHFRVKGIADTVAKDGIVPDSGPVSLNAVLQDSLNYTPGLINSTLDEVNAALASAIDAVEQAVDDELGEALQTAVDTVSRVEALEAMGGLSPESPVDGQTANLVEQPTTLTRQSLNAAIQSGMNAVSVKNFGAKGDGTTDDTAAIQSAIDWVADLGGGDVIVPGGIYMIKAHSDTFTGTNFMRDEGGIALKDNVHLRMSQGATLRAIPNDKRAYVIVRIFDKKNVTVSGGTIQGDRHAHTGTSGEWGYGIAVTGGENITLTDLTARDCWGDGINIQAMDAPVGVIAEVTHNLTISRVISTGNFRQGMSIEGVIGLHVSDSIFEKTSGKPPQAGVDIEPYNDFKPIENMVFSRCVFRANATWGLIAMKPQLNGLTIEDCLFEDNGVSQGQLEIYSAGTRYRVSRNTFRGTHIAGYSVWIRGGSDIAVSGNTCDSGIRIEKMAESSEVPDVRVENNLISVATETAQGILVRFGDRVTISRNTVRCNNVVDSSGIQLGGAKNVALNGNSVLNAANGIRLSRLETGRDCEDVTISQNRITDSASATILVSQTMRCLISENRVWGSSHQNNGGTTIVTGVDVSGLRVVGNIFHREPYGIGAGVGRSNFVISIASARDTVTEKNVIYGEGYALWSKTVAPTSGYMGEESGIMACPASHFPTEPTLGMMVLDTGSGVVSVWSGSEWVPLSGSVAGE